MSTLQATNLKHASSASNNIVLDSSGNVGIGTSSPRTRLDIAGGVISGVGNIHGNSNSTAYSIWGGESTLNGGYIQFWGSTSAAPNILVFGNSNSGENMRITSSGNVGIGTSGPSSKLDVAGQIQGAPIYIKSGGSTSTLFYDSALLLSQSGTGERMRIDSSGNVGIGTSSPSYKLDVVGTLRSTGIANFDNAISLNTASLNYLYYTSALALAQTGTGERMRIDNSGNVGIGTSSPGGKLHVNSSSGAAVSLVQAPAGSTAWFGLLGNGSSFLSGDFNLFHDGAQAGITMRANLPMAFSTNNTERMRITSDGNLLVGTTTVNAKLTVEGEGPSISTSYAYLALSGTTAITGYVASTSVPYSIWTSGRVSSAEFDARSDERLKKDITPIPVSDAWRFIQNVIPVHYKWINGSDDGHKFGFIAQDVVKAGFPNLVGQYADSNVPEVTDADGFTSPAGVTLTLNYDQIVPVLASALRDAMSQINDLKARLTALEAK